MGVLQLLLVFEALIIGKSEWSVGYYIVNLI